jgi:hypothetical protein
LIAATLPESGRAAIACGTQPARSSRPCPEHVTARSAVDRRSAACILNLLTFTLSSRSDPMYLIREIMYCKPGKVSAMKEKFLAMSKLSEKLKMPRMRIMTDFAAEQYWTVVAEMEVSDLAAFEKMMSTPQGSDADMKQMEELMKGYHDLVDHGKREIYRIEG